MFTTEPQRHGEGKTSKAKLELTEVAEATEMNRRPGPAVDPLAGAVLAKIEEQIERTIHLIGLVPDVRWKPPIPGAWSFAELLGHLLDCLAGVCAVLYATQTDELAHFAELQKLPVNFACAPEAARERIELYRARIAEGFAVLRDADLGRKLPTVFVAEGESVLTLLLGNLEHLINHKHQLFMYLKMLPVSVGTRDLYRLRSSSLA
jgi:DinB superfamily